MRSEQLERWLADEIAARTGMRPTRAYRDATFEQLGLDSAASVEIAGALAAMLGKEISQTLLFEQPTIGDLLAHLQDERERRDPAPLVPVGAGERPTALLGIALRLPQAGNLEQLWALTSSPHDALGAPPEDRFQRDGDHDPVLLRGGYLEDVEQFDALFFGISPREAASMDPQHRLLLELAWEAMERSGVTLEELRSACTGVFVGLSSNDFARRGSPLLRSPDRFTAVGAGASMAANRISVALGCEGPSMTVDTACSSALVALHLAHRSLQAGECDIALVGGASLMLCSQTTHALAGAGLLSQTGACRPFDDRADGFVRGEGAAVALLRRSGDVGVGEDEALALIHGSAVNSNGRTNGVSAPKLSTQRAVLERAYARAGVSPGSVGYIEAQAAGSRLGDAVEARALGAVLAADRPLERICPLGSVKGKIGHLEAASGMAGLAHVLACAAHEELPPVHGYAKPNAAVPFEELPLAVQSAPSLWRRGGPTRFAGLSASGLGGTNGHVVLELP